MLQKVDINEAFVLENGQEIAHFSLGYEVLGDLVQANSVVWVCHALTANTNPLEWWEGLVGEEACFSPKKHAIVCVNILGSCYGSTNAFSINPSTETPYLRDFPLISIRDFAKLLEKVRVHLGVKKIDTLIGASMGGMHAMEWAISLGEKLNKLVLLATSAKHSAWGIAFNQSQRMAIEADPSFGENHAEAGKKGMKAARAFALLSYRSADAYNQLQKDDYADLNQAHKVVNYQNYQGEKLAKRFDAYAYYQLSKSMDTHHVGRNRKSTEDALSQITAKTLVISIISDVLFPPDDQVFLAEHIPHAELIKIDSLYGHDGFLIETKQIASAIEAFNIKKDE